MADTSIPQISSVEFEELEDDPNWQFRTGSPDDSPNIYEIQLRHQFCSAVYSIRFTGDELDRVPDLDDLLGEAVDAMTGKHTPCPVIAGRIAQLTTG